MSGGDSDGVADAVMLVCPVGEVPGHQEVRERVDHRPVLVVDGVGELVVPCHLSQPALEHHADALELSLKLLLAQVRAALQRTHLECGGRRGRGEGG